MIGIWAWLSGVYQIRITGAEPERTIRVLSEKIRLENIGWESGLVVTVQIARRDLGVVQKVAGKRGDRIEILEEHGLPSMIHSCMNYPVIGGTVILLLVMTLWLPGQILFIRVNGNTQVPEGLILEQAARCGLSFGTNREQLRSEQIKNRLLEALPSLCWVGVNTSGCTATITVQERQFEPEQETDLPGNIVADRDAVVTEVTTTAGEALCVPGEAVKKGQVLISGFTDLGLSIHVERAEGEVYGLTRREMEAVIPVQTWIRDENQVVVKKYSLFFGKKRINLYSDSGILHIGCGKMTQIRYLRLPGGWTLPVGVITDIYSTTSLTETQRWEPSALDALRDMSAYLLKDAMMAGTILDRSESEYRTDGIIGISIVFDCQEMIGRHSDGIITEGDMQYDRENGERGAG